MREQKPKKRDIKAEAKVEKILTPKDKVVLDVDAINLTDSKLPSSKTQKALPKKVTKPVLHQQKKSED